MIKKIFRILICLLSLLFIVWFIAPAVLYRVLNIGNIVGVLICIFLIFRFGTEKLYNSFKEKLFKNKVGKVVYRILTVLACICLAYAVIISSLMAFFGIKAPTSPSDNTAVVLGAQVKPWGPSALLWQRIHAAEKYLGENPDAVAVVTGGKGDDEIMSEAQCMYENMVKDGVKADRIIKEDKATNTKENIEFSYKIIKDKKLCPDIAIVTDSYHQFRARIIARKQGVTDDISAVNTQNGFIGLVCYPTYFVREWLAIPVELLK